MLPPHGLTALHLHESRVLYFSLFLYVQDRTWKEQEISCTQKFSLSNEEIFVVGTWPVFLSSFLLIKNLSHFKWDLLLTCF